MLKLGEQNIKGLYLGEQKIKRAYLGEDLIFNAAKPSRLPEGYTELQYIQSDDNSKRRINTGKTYNENIKCVLHCQIDQNVGYVVSLIYSYGYSVSGSKYYATNLIAKLNADSQITANIYQGGTERFSKVIGTAALGEPIVIEFDLPNKKIKFNDAEFSIGSLSRNSKFPVIYLWGEDTNSTYGTPSGRIYSYQFFESGELTQDMVPCTNPSGIAGLYDIVGNEFFTSETSNSYTPGPAV